MIRATVNLREEEQRMVRILARMEGLNFSAFIRAKVRERYEEYERRQHDGKI